MNNQHAGKSGRLKHSRATEEAPEVVNWRRAVAGALIVAFLSLTVISPGSTLAEDQLSGTESSDDTGIQVASWLLTVPYCAGKSAFAIAGGVVGGLGYAFSGGNSKTAQSIWTTSVYGTYIIRPAHLRGEEPVHFLGKAEDEPTTRPVQHASGTTNAEKK